MKKGNIKKGMVVGFLILLIGAGVLPSMSGMNIKQNNADEIYGNENKGCNINSEQITPTDDAMIVKGNPDYPYGPYCSFQVRNGGDDGSYDQDILIKFNVLGLPSQISSATLYIYYSKT
ncbi:MAG: hypothetical protein MUO82_09430, partial [Candidatus Thermoplasmatota archaeon]|nr:hypothetical protein [Candidatus Thermoplasmatota archaeon]